MAISVWSATESKVIVDNIVLEGLQSIEFKVSRSRTDIIAVGQPLRQGIEYGVKVILGKLRIKSSCPLLDEKLSKSNMEEARFTLQAQLKKGEQHKTATFQECYLDDREFAMDVNGVGIAVYSFSATDVQES